MKYLFIILAGIFLASCSHEEKSNTNSIMTATTRSFSQTLFYAGTIQPLKTIVVTSPAEGIVVDMPFQYGEEVKAGQLIFQISSPKFLTDYKAALMQYIKAKSDFNTNKSLLSEARFLHKNQLISDDDFRMKQSGYYAAQLSLLQAKDALEIYLQQSPLKNINPYNLTIAEADKITQAIHSRMKADYLSIQAPQTGIMLAYSKSENENKKTLKGDAVKQGDVLAVIGDLSGVSVPIKVNELTVNQLQPGQAVKIFGVAFPGEILRGQISRVDKQGEIAGGFPTFNVDINISSLTAEQKKMIHVGMSAKVEIDLKQPAQLMIPIAAINERNGESFIQLYDDKTRTSHSVAIRTGKTTMNSVAILSGLKPGDKFVLPYSA